MFDFHAHATSPLPEHLSENAYICTHRMDLWSLAESFPNFAFGLLPEAEEGLSVEEFSARLEEALIRFPDAGVGEVGLDERFTDPDSQIPFFEEAVRLADRYSRVLTVHSVRSTGSTLRILRKYPALRKIWHSYTLSPELAKDLSLINCRVSLGPSFFKTKSSERLSEIFSLGALIESDLVLNDPSYERTFRFHALRFSETLGISYDSLEGIMNGRRAFLKD